MRMNVFFYSLDPSLVLLASTDSPRCIHLTTPSHTTEHNKIKGGLSSSALRTEEK